MRLVICWADISGYMAACWRALAAMGDVELKVIAFRPPPNTFSNDLVAGLNCRLLTPQEKFDAALISSLVKEHQPDVLYTTGWFHPPYRGLIEDPSLASVPKWMGVDTPWRGTFRQQLARLTLRRFVARMDRVFVAGERSWQYMRLLGVPEAKLRRGLYAADHAAFAPLYEQRLARSGGWPHKFLFVARYAPEKAIDVLVDAYARYRSSVGDSAWPLTCCGSGPLKDLLNGRSGITDRGFTSPADLPGVMLDHGAFVLPSRYEPWGVAVAEAASAGLPLICTEAVCASLDLLRPYFNGLLAATGNAASLAGAFRWIHDHDDQLPEMGRRSRELAAAYSAQMWAIRWAEALREYCK
jgi:glycosyltransferase involved in cell wall biosynthesis